MFVERVDGREGVQPGRKGEGTGRVTEDEDWVVESTVAEGQSSMGGSKRAWLPHTVRTGVFPPLSPG